jgi:hypothetical protein
MSTNSPSDDSLELPTETSNISEQNIQPESQNNISNPLPFGFLYNIPNLIPQPIYIYEQYLDPSNVNPQPSGTNLNPNAIPFVPNTNLQTINNTDSEDLNMVIDEELPELLNDNEQEENEAPNEVENMDNIPPQIRDMIRLYSGVGLEQFVYNIINPQYPSVEPNYLIEKFNELDIGICEIDYPFEGSTVKVFVPTIVAIDNPYFNRLINAQIINFKDILKEKETAIQIAYYIKTGQITPQVQPHHDELSGYSKKPLSEECIGKLKYKNIKDTPLINSIDDTCNCSICQAPIKELLTEDTEIVVLECGDYFCKDCILKWLKQYQNKCPNCNKVLANKEEEEKPRMTTEEILSNNFYKAAFFIIRYCSYYLQRQEINVQRIDQLNELFIQQGGLVSMDDCKAILEF